MDKYQLASWSGPDSTFIADSLPFVRCGVWKLHQAGEAYARRTMPKDNHVVHRGFFLVL